MYFNLESLLFPLCLSSSATRKTRNNLIMILLIILALRLEGIHYATNRKVAGSIPDDVIFKFT
jgi:hypothetical protein